MVDTQQKHSPDEPPETDLLATDLLESAPLNSAPLGIKAPFLSPKTLGQSPPRLQFMRPLGVRSLTTLNPSFFSSGETLQRAELTLSFRDFPFFEDSTSTPYQDITSPISPAETTAPSSLSVGPIPSQSISTSAAQSTAAQSIVAQSTATSSLSNHRQGKTSWTQQVNEPIVQANRATTQNIASAANTTVSENSPAGASPSPIKTSLSNPAETTPIVSGEASSSQSNLSPAEEQTSTPSVDSISLPTVSKAQQRPKIEPSISSVSLSTPSAPIQARLSDEKGQLDNQTALETSISEDIFSEDSLPFDSNSVEPTEAEPTEAEPIDAKPIDARPIEQTPTQPKTNENIPQSFSQSASIQSGSIQSDSIQFDSIQVSPPEVFTPQPSALQSKTIQPEVFESPAVTHAEASQTNIEQPANYADLATTNVLDENDPAAGFLAIEAAPSLKGESSPIQLPSHEITLSQLSSNSLSEENTALNAPSKNDLTEASIAEAPITDQPLTDQPLTESVSEQSSSTKAQPNLIQPKLNRASFESHQTSSDTVQTQFPAIAPSPDTALPVPKATASEVSNIPNEQAVPTAASAAIVGTSQAKLNETKADISEISTTAPFSPQQSASDKANSEIESEDSIPLPTVASNVPPPTTQTQLYSSESSALIQPFKGEIQKPSQTALQLPTVLQPLSRHCPLASTQALSTQTSSIQPSLSQPSQPDRVDRVDRVDQLDRLDRLEREERAIASPAPSRSVPSPASIPLIQRQPSSSTASRTTPNTWNSIADLLTQTAPMPSPPSSTIQKSPSDTPATRTPATYSNLHPFASSPAVVQSRQSSSPSLVLQREIDSPAEAPPASVARDEASPKDDAEDSKNTDSSPAQLEKLAQAIYQQVRQRLVLERERSGFSHSGRLL